MRTLIILADGMRPDAIENSEVITNLMKKASYTMNAKTVTPSVTLPCHMSLFHSVDPSRHGTTTNTYAPQVRPVNGLCEVLSAKQKKSAFFYAWEELRDLARPNSLEFSYFCRGRTNGYDKADATLTDAVIDYLNKHYTDFAFLYFGACDMAGHEHGWMSWEYMKAINSSLNNIEKVLKALPQDYTVFITADHGGHDRTHGTELEEDMTIPLFVLGEDFKAGNEMQNVNIKDIAPTVTKLLGVEADGEWEGKSLI